MISLAVIILICLCAVLSICLILAYRKLAKLEVNEGKYTTGQKTFSMAVAGIEASLDQEKQNSSRFLRILESIHDGVAFMDEDGRLQYVNTALWDLYGIPVEKRGKYMNASWLELYSPKGQDEIRENVLPTLEARKFWIGERSVSKQDGSVIRAELYISKAQGGYIGFIRDVTDRYNAELEKEELAVQVQQVQKIEALERVIRTLIHELTNELAAVNALAEFLMEELPEGSDTHGYAQKISIADEKMRNLLQQVRFLLPRVESASSFGFHSTTKTDQPAGQ